MLTTITWDESLVVIVGTDMDDVIVVDVEGANLVFSGSSAQVPITPGLRLDVQLLGGNDSFTNNTNLAARVFGEDGDDLLLGGDGNDEMYGGAGVDDLNSRGGDDRLDGGGQAQDRLLGGDGNDVLVGVTTNLVNHVLTVRGTWASEEIRVINDANDSSRFRVDGVEGIWLKSDILRVVVYLSDGDDRFVNASTVKVDAWGEAGDDNLTGQAKDLLDAGMGHDFLNGSDLLSHVEWTDSLLTIVGSPTNDTLVLRQVGTQVYLNGIPTIWAAPTKIILDGGGGNDRLIDYTRISNITLRGGDGDDMLCAVLGTTTLLGENGNDYLKGGVVTNQLNGGSGNDRLVGGSGSDIYVFSPAVGSER